MAQSTITDHSLTQPSGSPVSSAAVHTQHAEGDALGNYIHTACTGIGLAYSFDPHLGEERRAPHAGA